MKPDDGYPNKGVLYAAIADFKRAYCTGQTDAWPRYWREFATQAMADLIALEFQLKEKGIEIPKPKLRNREGA